MGKRGQGILLDFFISAVVFMIILAATFSILSNFDRQVGNSNDLQEINAVSQAAADALVSTRGVPKDWNSTSVQALGLLGDDGLVSKTKFLNLMATDYGTAKSLLGAGGYEMYARMIDSNNSLLNTGLAHKGPIALFITPSSALEDGYAFEMLNNTPLQWDLFWNSPAALPAATYRRAYTGLNGTLLFEALLKNASNYNYIIAYKADVNLTQMDAANRSYFTQAVNNGSRFIIVGSKANTPANFIASAFGVSAFKYDLGATAINITELDDVVQNVSIGDTQAVSTASYYLNWSASLRKFKVIGGSSAPQSCSNCEYCNICSFPFGSGSVHFLTDYTPWFAKGQTSIIGNFTEFGVYPGQSASQVTVVRRVAAISSGGKHDVVAVDVMVHTDYTKVGIA
jgi:hypothetical protein